MARTEDPIVFSADPNGDPPVTVVREMVVKPGSEPEFERLMSLLIQEGVKQPGHLGATVVKPTHPDGAYRFIYKFERRSLLEAWHASDLRQNLMKPVLPLIHDDRFDTLEGLETWFQVPTAHTPKRWKTTLLSWIAIFPAAATVTAAMIAADFHPHWLVRTLLLTAIVVPFTAYVGAPFVFRLFKRWV